MIALRSAKTLVASALTVCSLLAFSGTASAQLASCSDILTSPPLAGNQPFSRPRRYRRRPGAEIATSASSTATRRSSAMPPATRRAHRPRSTRTSTSAWVRLPAQLQHRRRRGAAARCRPRAAEPRAASPASRATSSRPLRRSVFPPTPAMAPRTAARRRLGICAGLAAELRQIKDWGGGRALHSHRAGQADGRTYYGAAAYDAKVKYTYWEGFSGGGHMGHTQLVYCPEEYDGYDISSPARTGGSSARRTRGRRWSTRRPCRWVRASRAHSSTRRPRRQSRTA